MSGPSTRVGEAWRRTRAFWLDPVDPRPVGWMRLSLGLLLVATHLFHWPGLADLMGPDALFPMEAVQEWRDRSWSPYALVRSEAELHALHAVLLLPLLGLTVGWQSRLMCLLALGVQLAYAHRAPLALHGGDRLLRLWCLYLSLVPSGAALSVDARLRRRRGLPPPRVPAVATRLVQLQLCVMYTATGLAKAQGSTWWDGSALAWALHAPHFQRVPALSELITGSSPGRAALSLGTWTTLAWEICFVPLVLWRRTRTAALALGLAMHAGIFLLMTVGSFSPASVWGYLAFWRPREGSGQRSERSGTRSKP